MYCMYEKSVMLFSMCLLKLILTSTMMSTPTQGARRTLIRQAKLAFKQHPHTQTGWWEKFSIHTDLSHCTAGSVQQRPSAVCGPEHIQLFTSTTPSEPLFFCSDKMNNA